jgi:hypothetical protein
MAIAKASLQRQNSFCEAPNSNIMKINEQENAIQNRIAIDSCTYLR